ncbi:MAG TPA: cell division protein ZapB [Desulfobulbus sp.]|nr:cell division protein ZapB [Desulfobulbus sp.]
MESNAELARLEQFVDKLLTKYHELKEEYHTLKATLQERDQECAELKENIADLSSERTVVGERVAGLIGRIEQWESELDTPLDENSDQGGVQGSLFEAESEAN